MFMAWNGDHTENIEIETSYDIISTLSSCRRSKSRYWIFNWFLVDLNPTTSSSKLYTRVADHAANGPLYNSSFWPKAIMLDLSQPLTNPYDQQAILAFQIYKTEQKPNVNI